MKKSIKILLIVAGAMLAVGLLISGIALMRVQFDFAKLSTAPQLERKEQVWQADEVEQISLFLSSETVRVGLSDDDAIHISYYDSSKEYTLSNVEGAVVLEQANAVQTGTSCENLFVLDWDSLQHNVELLLPVQCDLDLSIDVHSGDVALEAVSLENLQIDLTSGSVKANDLAVKSMSLRTTSGDVAVADLQCAEQIAAETESGSILFSDVRAGKVAMRCTSGKVVLQNMDANSIVVRATSGSVWASVVGSEGEYAVRSKTTAGDSNLPEAWGGGDKALEITTSSGDIHVDFLG